jgi:hypothetical protein
MPHCGGYPENPVPVEDLDLFYVGSDINAYAYVDITVEGPFPLIAVTSRTLEELTGIEETFLLGYDLGFILSRYYQPLKLLGHSRIESKPKEKIPPFPAKACFYDEKTR